MKQNQKKQMSFNQSRKLAYAAMAGEKDKESRNRSVSDGIGQGLTQANADVEAYRKQKLDITETERAIRRVEAKNKGEKRNATSDKLIVDLQTKLTQQKNQLQNANPTRRIPNTGLSRENAKAKFDGGTKRRIRLVRDYGHTEYCGNPACSKCFPTLRIHVSPPQRTTNYMGGGSVRAKSLLV